MGANHRLIGQRELLALARMVILVLDQQRKYFQTRSKDDLITSKRLEQQLRQLAESILEDRG